MSDKKTYVAAIMALLFIGIIVFWGLKQPEKANAPTTEQETSVPREATDEIIYFYGETCSHCIALNKFLEENKIAEKVNFNKKEVWSNKDNAAEMEKRAQECGIKREGMGVPFVYGKGKCYVGTPNAEAFFKQEAGTQ